MALEQLAHRLDLRAEGPAPAFTMDTLGLELQGQELPAAALAPGLAEGAGFARRLGLFLTGMARWVGDTLWTDGLTAGADLDLPRGAVGVAASYMNGGGDEGLEAASLALFGSHALGGDGPRLHAMAGLGRADAAEQDSGGAPLRFGEIGVRWRTGLGGGFGLSPDVRVKALAAPGPAAAGTPTLDGIATLAVDGAWTLRTGDLWVNGALVMRTDLSDGGRRDKGAPGARIRLGGRRPLRADLGLRLGLTLSEPSGEVFSLELANEDPGRTDGGHVIRMGWSTRF